jgi:DNA mismatch endonuclease, patch repair protein
MVDNLKPEDRRKTMQAVKSKRTKLEKRLFSMLAGMGLNGWKQNACTVIGKPDVVFFDQKIAIFVDGCFWHGCPICRRKLPQTNFEYWERKISRNIELAKSYDQQLRNNGWTVIRIWDHEITCKVDRKEIRARIRQAVKSGDAVNVYGCH